MNGAGREIKHFSGLGESSRVRKGTVCFFPRSVPESFGKFLSLVSFHSADDCKYETYRWTQKKKKHVQKPFSFVGIDF